MKTIDFSNERETIIIDGNQAIALGALVAGCKFFSSYPITPATSIGENLVQYLIEQDGFVYQAEDEIASLGAVIGASFSGVKSMTATSGPGLSLMQELIGFASMIELPIVIVDVQRGGPSTGMPTKHDQADLFASIFGSHGESQRIVIAPKDVEENFHLIIEAFNLSEKYQCPVIFLSDSSLSMISMTIEKPDLKNIKIVDRNIFKDNGNCLNHNNKFLRYKITNNGISQMLIPGVSSLTYTATSVEHDENSAPDHHPEIRTQQMRKRFNKIEKIEDENLHLIEWDLGDLKINDRADISIISWGLTSAITKESIRKLRIKGYKIAALYPKIIFPVCIKSINKIISMSDITFIPEANYTGQFAKLLRMYTDVNPITYNISRGEPFLPDEIENRIEMILKCKQN